MPTLPPFALSSAHRTRGRQAAATVVIAVAGALAALVGPAVPAHAERTPPGSAVPATGTMVRGVLERLAVEPDPIPSSSTPSSSTPSSSTPSGAADRTARTPTTWLRTTTSRIPIDADAVLGVPTTSTIAVRLGPASDAGTRSVTALTVLSRATSTPRAAAAAAVHTVTVVLAQPAGARPDKTTAASLTKVVNGGVATFWSQASDGRITFSVARAHGWTTLSSSCRDVWAVWEEARRRAGFVPGPRRHLVVYVPPGSGCPTGLATVGADRDTGGYALVGGTTPGLLAHELGHNLGLGHSDALACAGAADGDHGAEGFAAGCRRVPYGDWYDVMGISWENVGSLSTAHAFRLGLLGSGSVATARSPMRTTLRPVSGRVGVRSLRIQDPAGATYVVEYRPATGADRWLDTAADWRGLRPGVLLRRLDPHDTGQTLLLDATPAANSATNDVDVVLPPGRVVTTASGRVSVVVESVSPGAAIVAVAVDGAWPTLVVEPRGRLVDGRQVTIGQALATWGLLAS